jgi:hypothetical protein
VNHHFQEAFLNSSPVHFTAIMIATSERPGNPMGRPMSRRTNARYWAAAIALVAFFIAVFVLLAWLLDIF